MRKARLGIVVPYRRRPQHLDYFLDRTKKYFDSTDIDYKILIVNQDDAKPFNRGVLCNIGFKEAKKYRCDYVAFHDVDKVPIRADYSYPSHPVHLITSDLPFESYFGGITLFNVEDFEKINGFSNEYWGWGYEDDDLLYRCIKKNLILDSRDIKIEPITRKVVNFNGVNSFARINNEVNVKRNFKIKTDILIGELIFDGSRETDIYPIFNIRGYDFELVYTSFRRLILKVFDNTGKFYQIYTNITKEIQFNVEIEYIHKERTVVFTVNDEEIGKLILEKPIYNYNTEKSIFLGADNNLQNFFSGVIKTFEIENSIGEKVVELNGAVIEDYKLKDTSGNNNNASLFNTPITRPEVPETQRLYFPYRRFSRLKELPHESSGFNGGRWESDLTRWNELKYYNEVSKGYADNHEDGLTTLQYICHSRDKSDDRRTITINIGL